MDINKHFIKVWCLSYICLFYVYYSKGCPDGLRPLVNFEVKPQLRTTVGSNITLYCTSNTTGEQFKDVPLEIPLSIEIYKKTKKLITCQSKTKHVVCTWRIDNVQQSHAGLYFCVSKIEGGATGCMLKNLTLDVRDCTHNKSNQLSIEAAVTKNNTIIITWNYAIESCDKTFIIYWSENGPVTKNSTSYNLSNLSRTSYEIEGLEPNRQYWVGLAVFTTNGLSEIHRNEDFLKTNMSNILNCTHNKSNQLSIEAAVTKNNTIIITWNYAIESCDKTFIIYWSENGPVTKNSTSYNLSNLSRTSYEIEGLEPNRQYWVGLAVFTTNGLSEIHRNEEFLKTNMSNILNTTAGPTSAHQEGDNGSTPIIIIIFVVLFVCFLVAVGIIWRVIVKRKRPGNDAIPPVRMQTNGAAQNLGILFPEERMPNNSSPLPQKSKLDDVLEDDEIPEYLTVINSEYLAVIDEWEVPRDRLLITNKKLGVGQFGIVKKGIYRTMKDGEERDQPVAVKELKENASEIDRSDLLTELRILKFVNSRPHPNILKLIGACTSEPPVLVITEYCSKGNLQNLLRSSHSILTGEISTEIECGYKLNHYQLLKMAVDVACGMEHLASMKNFVSLLRSRDIQFVHRDLAARNILIGEEWVAKIADFGLARETAAGGEYIKTRRNLLPVKWTAIEALVEGKFSTASDVWSYGVLLWEISNIGGEPYKGISPYDIMSHVGSGGRLQKPERCSPYLYEIMKECWETAPEKRPSFKDIHKKLAAMLDQTENLYINVEFMDAEAGKSNGNYERYTCTTP